MQPCLECCVHISPCIHRSGTEEQYDEIHQLCQEVTSYIESNSALKTNDVVASKKKFEQRKQATAVREAAMKRMTPGNDDENEGTCTNNHMHALLYFLYMKD